MDDNLLKQSNTLNDTKTDSCSTNDPELDSLLDSALGDFDREHPTNSNHKDSTLSSSPPQVQSENVKDDKENGDVLKDVLNEAFGQNSSNFQDLIKEAIGDNTTLASNFTELSNLADQIDGSQESQDKFAETLKKTLNSLSENTENLESDVNEDELLKVIEGLGLDGLGSDDPENGFMASMQGMMRSVLSKDILYPSLKEISCKYPSWLSENKAKISESEYQRYSKQHECMAQVCIEFESERPNDTEDVKNKRFEQILNVMQQMQLCGQPPEDLVGNMNPMPDLSGFPKFDATGPPIDDECCIM